MVKVKVNSLRSWFPLRLALDDERFVILVRPRLHLEQNLGGGRLLDDEGRTLNSKVAMKVKVTLYVAGNVFDEIVEARNYQDAKKTALARNPTAKVVSVTAVF